MVTLRPAPRRSVEHSGICPIGTDIDAHAALRRYMNNIDEVRMKGGFSADNVDCLYSDPVQSVEHGPRISVGTYPEQTA